MRNSLLILPCLLMIQTLGCNWSDQPVFLEYRRPANVPSDAVLVQLSKGGAWQRCEVNSSTKQNRCQIFNWKGGVLYDETFLPYDEGLPVGSADLRIPRYVPAVGLDWICLENGRILLPESRFQELKSFLGKGTPNDNTLPSKDGKRQGVTNK